MPLLFRNRIRNIYGSLLGKDTIKMKFNLQTLIVITLMILIAVLCIRYSVSRLSGKKSCCQSDKKTLLKTRKNQKKK